MFACLQKTLRYEKINFWSMFSKRSSKSYLNKTIVNVTFVVLGQWPLPSQFSNRRCTIGTVKRSIRRIYFCAAAGGIRTTPTTVVYLLPFRPLEKESFGHAHSIILHLLPSQQEQLLTKLLRIMNNSFFFDVK